MPSAGAWHATGRVIRTGRAFCRRCLVSRHSQKPEEDEEEVKPRVHEGTLYNDQKPRHIYATKWTNKSIAQGPSGFDMA